ncbi:uncharacterized protein LOC109200580 [Oreochromis niloticus]|uniref:uncharacterized protein LOC109200580 n=1 Tax=Oreochromis niloticus TaxID=8128 RepID=UPI000DF23393|nr:uncharacterized protein LOC109200580 [Oreochromis niloticus]
MVHFVLGDRVLQITKLEKNGSVTTGTLQTDFGSFKFVHCLANNTLGNANLTLSLPANDNMQNIFIASGAGVIFLIILIAIGVGTVKRCRGQSDGTPKSDLSTMRSDRPAEPLVMLKQKGRRTMRMSIAMTFTPMTVCMGTWRLTGMNQYTPTCNICGRPAAVRSESRKKKNPSAIFILYHIHIISQFSCHLSFTFLCKIL